MITRLLILLLLSVRIAHACSCRAPEPPLKALARAEAVFTGKVIRIAAAEIGSSEKHQSSGFKVTVETTKSLKGGITGTVLVFTGTGGGDCGYPFDEGESYLIYANRMNDGGWSTNICMRTAALKHTGEEVLELEGKLPPPKSPSQAPLLELKGITDDAGYHGYVFTCRNRLHERIFHFADSSFGHRIQIQINGVWSDYPPNGGLSNREELSPSDVAAELSRWKEAYRESGEPPPTSASFVDRLDRFTLFVARSTTKAPWRIGFQYVTEREFDAGAKIQDSKRTVWSEPIVPSAPARSLSFKEAFEFVDFR